LAQFHCQVLARAGEAFFALPITVAGTERWSSLAGFQPGQFVGPWELDMEALDSIHLRQAIQTGSSKAFIGGPCWFRWQSEGTESGHLDWIPLIYCEARVEVQDGRLRIAPVRDGWRICPLVTRFIEQQNIATAEPLNETLPDLLTLAESKAAQNGHDLTRALVDALQLVVPELGELLIQARDNFPHDRAAFAPSPWVLFSAAVGPASITEHLLRDYGALEDHLAASPHHIGGLGLLEGAPGAALPQAREIASIIPLNDSQRHTVEAALSSRPVTVVSASSEGGKNEVLLSILLNAWASSTRTLFATSSNQTANAVCQRLNAFESEFEIAIRSGEQSFDNIHQSLTRAIDLITARRSESHYGGSLSARKDGQLNKKKQRLREMLDSQVPQRLSKAIEAALESHAGQRQALAALKSQREELVEELHRLGAEDAPDAFGERVVDPLRKWRNGIDATKRLIKEDAQRDATLKKELSTAVANRDSALAGYQMETPLEDPSSWLLGKPGFESFEQAMVALSDKLREPIEDEFTDADWKDTYDRWPSSEAAAGWERKAREMVALLRPAGIALKEKADEVRAAREAVDTTQSTLQQATATSSFDAPREDLDEWATCYAELCALPPAKIAFLPQSKSAELVRKLEKVESRFRISLPVHLWTSIGALNETGRSRLSAVIDRAREWHGAREHWDRLSTVRDEIETETDALRRRLVALGIPALADEVTPAACTAIASKLSEEAAVAAAAAVAWTKRETRERLPGELADLAAQIREAGTGMPIKERWMNGAGGPLVAALGSVASNPGLETIRAVRDEVLGPIAADPILEHWRQAYHAEHERVAIAEELERIPSRAARLSHWKSRRPGSIPPELDVADAFEGDDAHPVWTFLEKCEAWNERWTSYRDEQAPALERTANAESAEAIQRIGEATQALPKSKERAWLEAFANGSAINEPWPVDKLTELAALWQPDRLQAAIDKIDEQLKRIIFESAREQWLDRAAGDAQVLPALGGLRDHYKNDPPHIEESAYPHFQQALTAQPLWVTTATSARSIPILPGLFDLLVIDDATQCTLTSMLPLIFRAKRLVVIGDPEQLTSTESVDVQAERTLAARLGVEEWAKHLGHTGNSTYEAAVNALPHREGDVSTLTEDGS
jgi:hypothetical protein